VYGALAFYLAHREEIDQYLRQGEAEYEKLRQKHLEQLRTTRPQLYQKLMAHKQRQAAIDTPPEPMHQWKFDFRRMPIWIRISCVLCVGASERVTFKPPMPGRYMVGLILMYLPQQQTMVAFW
jgi:hypothetical protein